jgi:SAM-dependent methyltransferase
MMIISGENHIEIISPLQSHTFLESWYELSDESHFWFQWRLKALMQQLDDLNFPIHQKLKVLDVGCGTGVVRSQIEAVTAWEVDATDLDYNALRHAKPGRGRIMYYDILERKVELKESYDVVVLFDVLEHIEQTQPFIKALLHHLKVGGYLLINVPAMQSLYSRYDEAVGHIRRYNKITLRDELLSFPLIVRNVRYWGLANIPILLARKLWLALSPGQKAEEVIQQGMKPPGRLVNDAFLYLMRLEMMLTNRPLLGSSVLMMGEKGR